MKFYTPNFKVFNEVKKLLIFLNLKILHSSSLKALIIRHLFSIQTKFQREITKGKVANKI